MQFFGARQSKLISIEPHLLDGGISAAEVATDHMPGLTEHADVFAGKTHLVSATARYGVTVPMSAWVYGAHPP